MLIDIALLQCTCQVYTNIAVFKVNTMIIISYPRGTLFTSDISTKLSVINGGKPPHLYLVCLRQVKVIVTVKKEEFYLNDGNNDNQS